MSVQTIGSRKLVELRERLIGLEKEKEELEEKINGLRQKFAETSCPCEIGAVFKSKRNGRFAQVIKVEYSEWRDYELIGRNICKNGSLGAVVTIDEINWIRVETDDGLDEDEEREASSLDFFPSLAPRRSKSRSSH